MDSVRLGTKAGRRGKENVKNGLTRTGRFLTSISLGKGVFINTPVESLLNSGTFNTQKLGSVCIPHTEL